MDTLTYNLFLVENLKSAELRARLLSVAPQPHGIDTFAVLNRIAFRVSSMLRTNASRFLKDHIHYIAIPADKLPKGPIKLQEGITYEIRDTGTILSLDPTNSYHRYLIANFIAGAVKSKLWQQKDKLWNISPRTFYEVNPSEESNGILVFRGFNFRVQSFSDGKVAIAIDCRTRFVDSLSVYDHYTKGKLKKSLWQGLSWMKIRRERLFWTTKKTNI